MRHSLPLSLKLPSHLFECLVKLTQLQLLMFQHFFLSLIDFGYDDLKSGFHTIVEFLCVLYVSFNNDLKGLVHLNQPVAVMILKHTLYADSHVARNTKVFHGSARMPHTLRK